ncbi:hypothetical protein [Natrinema sp. 1APR25-10V2]|uniref:hypothetical protein n=1 Tax=Natrinema sp. 1APR25-10V2 TaxID=2951081 RepID=UPI002877227D|nr:hypothetical protein [Natrinema sp. 1APR25-10V2]MDS0478563.1 hypothetical protein [Natrinema sp. 1APR25-10V2]
MASQSHSGGISVLMYIGTVILFGIPVMILSFSILLMLSDLLLKPFNVYVSDGASVLLLIVLSVLIGLQLAVEVTAVRLDGIHALKRGSPRITFLRYFLLIMAAFVMLVAVIWIGLFLTIGGSWSTATIAGILIIFVGLLALSKRSNMFSNSLEASVDEPK